MQQLKITLANAKVQNQIFFKNKRMSNVDVERRWLENRCELNRRIRRQMFHVLVMVTECQGMCCIFDSRKRFTEK